MAKVGASSTMVVELPAVEFGTPVAEALDEVAPTTITILLQASDGGTFSSLFVFQPSIVRLLHGVPDGAGKLFTAPMCANALQHHLVEIEGALISEWYEALQQAGLQATVDMLRIFANIFEKLVHPIHRQDVSSLLLGILGNRNLNEAGPELLPRACFGEIHIRAHLPHLRDVELAQ